MTAKSAEQGAQSERVQDLHPADHAEAQEQAQYAAAARWNSDKFICSETAAREMNYRVETDLPEVLFGGGAKWVERGNLALPPFHKF